MQFWSSHDQVGPLLLLRRPFRTSQRAGRAEQPLPAAESALLVVSRPSCSLMLLRRPFRTSQRARRAEQPLPAAESAILVVSRPSCSVTAAEKAFSDFSASRQAEQPLPAAESASIGRYSLTKHCSHQSFRAEKALISDSDTQSASRFSAPSVLPFIKTQSTQRVPRSYDRTPTLRPSKLTRSSRSQRITCGSSTCSAAWMRSASESAVSCSWISTARWAMIGPESSPPSTK